MSKVFPNLGHALTLHREGKIPFPDSLMFTPAQDNDLTVFKQLWGDHICNTKIFADKIYSDFEYFNDEKKQKQHIEILTPVKLSRDNPNKKVKAERPIMTSFPLPFPRLDNP